MSQVEHDDSSITARIERYLGIGVLLLLLIGSLLVMRPFLSALAWAFVLAFSLWPVQRRLAERMHGRKTLAALTMTMAIAVVLVLPVLVMVSHLAADAHAISGAAKAWFAGGPPAPPAWVEKVPLVGENIASYWQVLADDAARLMERIPATPDEIPMSQTKLGMALGALFAWARTWVPAAGLAIVNGFMQIVLSVFLTFFIFQNGDALAARLNTAVRRIGRERGANLVMVAGSTIRGVVYGILGTAFVQGTMAGFGFFIAGVPGPVLLGFVTFVLSAVPVGPPLVWIPASLWLFNNGQTGWGIFMIIWGLGVSTVDNIVKPLIISRGSATPFILILFGVIGGALSFGFIGVFLGPTLLAVAYRLIETWSRDPATETVIAEGNA